MDQSMNFGAKPNFAAKRCLAALLFALSLSPADAQTLSNALLNGRYFARHIEFTTDAANNVTDARSLTGVVQFSGTGSYSFAGQQVIGTGSPLGYSVSGTYAVSPSGVVTLTNPQKATLTINARYSSEAVAGASTEAPGSTFDFFIAIPAPPNPQANSNLSGNYYAADLELTSASMAQVRNSWLTLTADGAGNFTALGARGHAANVGAGALQNQSVTGATYSVAIDGTGTATLPYGPGLSLQNSLLSATTRNLQISASGNILLIATPGAHDILIAVKVFTGSATSSSLALNTWYSGLRADSKGGTASFVGSRRRGADMLVHSRRLNLLGAATPLNETAATAFTVATDGTGSAGASKTGLGTGGNLMVSASVTPLLDPSGYEIGFAMPTPTLTGTGVFINPLGVLNGGSAAPALDAVSPGEFIAIYGSGLAATPAVALPPYPASLGGVSVTIGGLTAPLYYVSPGQLNCLVPYGITGATVDIVVRNNNVASNTVTLAVANTTPGIFTLDSTGTHHGAILHGDYSVVNASSPAVRGETVSMYLTGLGPLTTPVADGFGATAVNFAKTQLQVLVNGIPATVQYSGLSVLPGLYQINFTVPAGLAFSGNIPVSILTPEAFHDQVSIAVR
jgi:uncharacterized protein (TIGR03437 family)